MRTPQSCRLLFTPREAKRPEHPTLNIKEVIKVFGVLELRERLIVKFAVLGGMRPGESFALRRGGVRATCAEVKERLYRGDIDTPKTGQIRALCRTFGRVIAGS